MSKNYFITFGGGDINYFEAVTRLKTQAKDIKIFDKIEGFTTINLVKDKKFWNKHGTFMKENPRGFGYWLWKPYLIRKKLKKLQDGDVLFYIDSGCEIDYRNKKQILDLLKIVKTDKIIGSIACGKKHPCIEKDWTKMDTFIKLDATDPIYTDTPQRQASALIILKCKETDKIINEWYKYACDYHLLDDSPSKEPNFMSFKDNRHDQSIFSILTKKYKIFSDTSITPAIYLSRNRTGISKIY